MRRLFSPAPYRDELESGLIFSSPEMRGSHEREIALAFNEEQDWPGCASVGFTGLNFRCGHGSATKESLGRDGVDVAPREWWPAIREALYGEEPIDYLWCDVGERQSGRVLHAEAAAPERPGDEWIARQLITSPLLRYRWRRVERDALLDGALQRMLEGDDDEVIAAAHGLEVPEQGWWQRNVAQPVAPPPWSVVADLCRSVLSAPTVGEAPSASAKNGDAARELRIIAASMFDGPLYVPGLWPVTIDRIMLQLDERA